MKECEAELSSSQSHHVQKVQSCRTMVTEWSQAGPVSSLSSGLVLHLCSSVHCSSRGVTASDWKSLDINLLSRCCCYAGVDILIDIIIVITLYVILQLHSHHLIIWQRHFLWFLVFSAFFFSICCVGLDVVDSASFLWFWHFSSPGFFCCICIRCFCAFGFASCLYLQRLAPYVGLYLHTCIHT